MTDNTMGNRRTDNAMDRQYNGQQTKDKRTNNTMGNRQRTNNTMGNTRTDNTMGNRQRIEGQTIQWAIEKGQTIQ
jgi:hypothetical protein